MSKKTVFLMSIAFCCILAVAIGLFLPSAGMIEANAAGETVSCTYCNGTGLYTSEECPVCHGLGSYDASVAAETHTFSCSFTTYYSHSGYIVLNGVKQASDSCQISVGDKIQIYTSHFDYAASYLSGSIDNFDSSVLDHYAICQDISYSEDGYMVPTNPVSLKYTFLIVAPAVEKTYDVTFVLMDNSTQVTKSLTEITQDFCDSVWAEWKEAYPDLYLTDKYWLLIQKDGTSYGSTLPFTVDSADYVVVMESLFPVTFEFPDGSTKVDRLDYITQSVIDNMWSEWSTSNNYSWGYSRVLTYDGQVSDSVTLEYPLAVLYKDLHIVFIPYSYKVTFDLNLPEGVTGYAVGEIAENGDYNDASVMYEAASAVAYGSLVDSTTVLNCASVVGIGCYKDWATLSENYIFLGWALSPTARADDVVIPASFFKEQLIEGTSYINLVPDTSKDGGVVYITQETTFYAVYSSLHIRIYSPSDYFSVFDESKVEGGTCYNCITDDITSDVEAFVLSLILPKYLTYYKGISLFDSEEILTIPHTITEEDLDSNGCYSYRLRFDFVDCPYCDDGCDYCYNCSFLVPWDVTFSFTDNSTQIVKRLTEVTQEVCDSVWAEWREAYPDLSSTEKYWLLIDQNATSDGIASPIKVDAPGFLVIMFSFSPVAFEFPDGSTKVDRLDYITQSVIDDMWSEWSTANNYSWGYSRILAYDGQVSDSVTLEYPLAVLYTDLHIVFSPHSYKVTFDLNLPEGSTGYAVGEVAENGDYNDTSVMYEAASAVSYGSYLNTTSVLNCVPVVGIGCYSNWLFLSFCYAFLGWGTSPTAGADDVVIPASFFEAQEMEGTSYVNLIPVTSEVGGYIYITQDTTFYAVYSIFEISIVYESNGGDLSGDYTTTLVAVQPLLLPAVTKEDYDFKGWYYDPACTIPYKKESGINLLYVTEDYTLTLYAAYKEKSIFSDILTFIKQVCIVAVIAIVAYVVLAVFSSGHKKS